MAEKPNRTLRGKQQFTCETCGVIREQWPSQVGERFFCSRRCYWDALKGREPHNKGTGELVTKTCSVCGTVFGGPKERYRSKQFCSRSCAGRASHGALSLAEVLQRQSKPDLNGGCHLWIGSLRGGYGRMRANGRTQEAHRVAYEEHYGPIPTGLVLDHKCRVRCCINPLHLEPVTHAENIRRGEAGKGPRSQAHRDAVSAAHRKRYQDPKIRAEQAARLAEHRQSPKRLEALGRAKSDPEYRAAQSERMKRIWAARKRGSDADC